MSFVRKRSVFGRCLQGKRLLSLGNEKKQKKSLFFTCFLAGFRVCFAEEIGPFVEKIVAFKAEMLPLHTIISY